LSDDLRRLEQNREQTFRIKFKAFDESQFGFVDGVKNMRKASQKEMSGIQSDRVDTHPWFGELLNRIEMSSAGKEASSIRKRRGGRTKTRSQCETLLLERIRMFVEDGLEFTQVVFLSLLKVCVSIISNCLVIPTHEWARDEIQRIIRFLKQKVVGLNERDYITCVETAGHRLILERECLV
jgi:hypothetical protein